MLKRGTAILVSGMLLFLHAYAAGVAAAPASSFLDGSIKDARDKIAIAAACRWTTPNGGITGDNTRLHACTREFSDTRNWVWLESTPEEKIDNVTFRPLLAEDYPQFHEIRREREATIKAITTLLPDWQDGRMWLENALSQVLESGFGFETSIRVGSISIYVKEFKYVSWEGRFAHVVLTTDTDFAKHRDR